MSPVRPRRFQILRFSLRAKFLALFFLVVASTSAGFGWYFYDHSSRSISEQMEERVRTIAWTLAFNCRYAVMTGDRVVLEEIADSAFSENDIVHVAVSDHEGRVLVERWKEGYGPGAPPSGSAGGSLFEVEMMINSGSGEGTARVDPDVEAMFGVGAQERGSLNGTVRVGLSRLDMENGLGRALRSSLILFSISLSVGVALVLLFLGYLIHPIRRLSERLVQVADGDFNTRLPVQRTDEIGQLARSFNRMAESLQVSRAAAKEAQEALLQSNRLAAVGEIAGQAAHEILNPIAAVHGRLENERHDLGSHCGPLLQVFEQIVRGWSAEYRTGGLPGLIRSLEHGVAGSGPSGTIPLIEEDLGNLEQILAGLKRFQSQRAQQIDSLLREVERITRIVEGMRSMSRAAVNLEDLEVHEILRESIEVLKDPLEKRAIRVEVKAGAGPLRVRADRGELIQIFTNLLRNSMQAIDSARARGEGEIHIEIAAAGGLVGVKVRDNGAGISPDHQSMLFETTFTTKGPKEGTGLGLGICRRLARRTSGDVRLGWSTPAKGTMMVVELPRSDAA